jgi:transcriptional regulator with XRE-family HTH domain
MVPNTLDWLTPREMAEALAERIRFLRLDEDWTQKSLAERAGVSLASYKRFESSGLASLALVLRVAHALGRLEELQSLFLPPRAKSLAELEERAGQRARQGGRKRGRR